jgi:hypothetical protein
MTVRYSSLTGLEVKRPGKLLGELKTGGPGYIPARSIPVGRLVGPMPEAAGEAGDLEGVAGMGRIGIRHAGRQRGY